MKKVDFIIVGAGYAGLFFAHQLIKHNRSFFVFFDVKTSASQVSAGIINPAVLKRFTTFWKAQEQIDSLRETIKEIQKYTGENYLIDETIHRIFHDEVEKNFWLKKSNSEELQPFLDSEFYMLDGLKNPFGTGKVKQSARLNVNAFFNGILKFLKDKDYLIEEKFNYDLLNPIQNTYSDRISFKNIVFAEGMAVKDNKFFKDIPVRPNKGHHITVDLGSGYHQNPTVKKKHFLFPTSNGHYYYGGTYDRELKHGEIDGSAILQLENGLKEFYPGSFIIKEKKIGFRPTVVDRRPILGQHPDFKNLYVFNGLGARGILNGNYFSKVLFDCIENQAPLPEEVNLARFGS